MSQTQSFEEKSELEEIGVYRAGTPIERRIDHAPGWAFVWLSAFYFVAVFLLSSHKLLWLDELITLHLARLGGTALIWNALAKGADPNPPVTYILVHFFRELLGEREFS